MSITGRDSSVATLDLEGTIDPFNLNDVQILPIGQPAAWLDIKQQGDSVVLRPHGPMPKRCTIRPAALFSQDRGFPDVSTVMGRVTFDRGSTSEQTYRAYTCDPQRRVCELFFPVEAVPDDEWPTSGQRWSNFQAIAKRLIAAADVPWNGLSSRVMTELVDFVPWPEPLEGCLLHALTQWTQQRGRCVIEIGSLRGRSLSMLAMALRGAKSESSLISIDPHWDQPHNHGQVRIALRQIGEEDRLVQIRHTSETASRILGREVASLIFIDGDHSYDQALDDFNICRELLAPGGCMVFHDYGFGKHNGQPDFHPGVTRTIDEHVFSESAFRPLLLAHTLFAFVKIA